VIVFNYRLFAITLAMFILISFQAKGLTISGTVIDSLTGEVLPGASIIIEKTSAGAVSDHAGRFILKNIPTAHHESLLKVHLIGYEDKYIDLSNQHHIDNLEIYLKPSQWELDNIVVTATRRGYILKDVPITTELVTAEDFSRSGAASVDEALDSHIGVNISDDFSGRGISLRGVDPSRVLILVDGNRVVGRVRGSVDLSQIPLGNVRQIEIVKGTGSTLYGSDALGGVVNIITKNPADLTKYQLHSGYGSFNSYDFQADLNAILFGTGSNLSLSYDHTDGFDLDKSTEHTNGLEKISRFNLNSRTILPMKPGWRIELTPSFMTEKKSWIESEVYQLGIDRDTVYNFDDFEYNYRYDLALNSKWFFGDKADFTIGLHGSYYDHRWEKYTRPGLLDDRSVTADDIGEASFQYNRQFARGHILTFGGDAASQRLKSDQLATGEERINSGDLYAQYEYRPFSPIVIMPGLRWEHHDTYGDHYNPSLNLMWEAGDFIKLRGTISEGFRAPSIKEVYFEFDHSAAGYLVLGGGESLKPEESVNYSLTADINYKRKALHRLTYFRNDLKNLIDFSEGDFSNPTYWRGIYYYENIYKARTEGIEWETDITMFDRLNLSFSYTYLKAKNITENIKLINRPEHTFKFNTTYDLEKLQTSIIFWGYWHDHKLWVSQGDTPQRNVDEYAPSRWNLNIGVSRYILKKLKMLFKVENIGDQTNATYGYWPPRSFSLNLNFEIGGSKK
jgi:outer membrane receptor for ferrienterochelin and colicins